MAECCYTRCVQERRNIRRDLQKWTKNMVQVVGLERIAEELMGRRKWKQYQESLSRSILHQPPINNNVDDDKLGERLRDDDALAAVDGEVVRVRDWSPTSEKCGLCVDSDGNLEAENHGNGHHAAPSLQSPHASDSDSSAESRSEGEAEVEATSSHPHQNNNTTQHNTSPHLTMSALESVHSMLAAAAVLQPFYQQHHPPAVFPPPHWYLSTLARHLQEAATTTVPPVSPPIQQQQRSAAVAMPPADQPLDLSAKPSGVNNSMTQASFDHMKLQQRTFDPKQIFKAKPRLSGPVGAAGGGPGGAAGRRAYTEDELQAALRDIQSGKLGTRRAAVIYGIPRSTLRNKVYKLAMERERDTLHLPQVVSAPSPSASPSEVVTPTPAPAPAEDDELSAAEEEKEVEKVLQKPLLSMDDILRFSAMEGSGAPDALKGFLQRSLRDKQDLWASLEHSAVGSYIQSLLAASGLKQEDANSDDHHFNNGTSTHRSENNLSRQSSSSSVARDAAVCDAGDASDTRASSDSPSSVILKIPSFRPSAATSPPAPKSLMSLRDVIAKSISQKFQQTGTPPPQSSADYDMGVSYKRSRFTPPLPLGPVSVIKSHHQDSIRQYPMSQHHQSQNKPAGSSSSSSGGCTSGGTGTGGKGTRPKRGKYRNYDRDSLVEAVRAVQRGEMSVHRAGSYYGVPHSTLEYKVKERHLMRPRKRDPKPPVVDDKQTKPGMPAVKSGQTPNKPPSYATSPNGLKLPPLFEPVGYTPPPPPAFPFWHHASFPPLGYAPNAQADLFATQMMQRLHERGDESPGPANGSFLDGIIRSSLDKQPEDKNRALLDQLCRDTRPAERKSVHSEEEETTESTPPPMQQTSRIYVKPQLQEITKPENLKPEALMRLRDHNGQV